MNEVQVKPKLKRRDRSGPASSARKKKVSSLVNNALRGPGIVSGPLVKGLASKKKKSSIKITQATTDYLFAKQAAQDSFRLPTLPAKLFDQLQKSPVLTWRKIMNVFEV